MSSILYFDTLDSTNSYAKEHSAELESYSVVVAERQTLGKGSISNLWYSDTNKGLWFTFIIKNEIFWANAFFIEILASIAVAESLHDMGIDAALKWPNDVMVNKKKICGVLSEVCGELERLDYQILGVGLNVNQNREDFPLQIQDRATSIHLETKSYYDKKQILDRILEKIIFLYEDFKINGKKRVLNIWRKNNCSVGESIRIKQNGEVLIGRFVGIYNDFSPLVELPDKKRIKLKYYSYINFV